MAATLQRRRDGKLAVPQEIHDGAYPSCGSTFSTRLFRGFSFALQTWRRAGAKVIYIATLDVICK
jgi:hypothetical protein